MTKKCKIGNHRYKNIKTDIAPNINTIYYHTIRHEKIMTNKLPKLLQRCSEFPRI